MEEDENKWENKPTEVKVQHKLTKARQAGYDEYKVQMAKNQINFDDFLSSFGEKNFFNDPIELCRDKAADLFKTFLEKAKLETILRSQSYVLSGLINNCLNGKTRQKAVDITLEFIKLDKKFLAFEALSKATTHKNPKIGQASLETMKKAITDIDLDYEKAITYIKPSMELIESREKIIRDELRFLLIELAKKLGPKWSSKIKPLLSNVLADNKRVETIIKEIESAIQSSVQTAEIVNTAPAPVLPVSSQAIPKPEVLVLVKDLVTDEKKNDSESKIENPIQIEIPEENTNKTKLEKPEAKIEEDPMKKVNFDPKEIDNSVIKCVIKDGKYLSAGTIELLKSILPNYAPPSKKEINKHLDKKKQEYDKDLAKLFENVSDIALSSELLKNSRNSYFLCLRAHYYDKNFNYKSSVIGFRRFIQSEHLNIKINSFIKHELNKLNIADKIRTITTNNSANMIKATSNNEFGTRISCLVENLNSTVADALNSKKSNEFDRDFQDESHYDSANEYDSEGEELVENKLDEENLEHTIIEEYNSSYDTNEELNELDSNSSQIQVTSQSLSVVVNKVRKLIRLISNSKELSAHVRKEALKENIKQKLMLDLDLSWQSTHMMIENFLKHSKIIDDILLTRPASISFSKIESLKAYKFDVREIILLKALSEVLSVFYEQSKIISSKSFLPLSFSQVIVSNLKQYLLDKSFLHNNSQCVNEIKELFYDKYLLHFNNEISPRERYLRLMATYLNPVHFRYLSQLEKMEVENCLETLEFSFVNVAKCIIKKFSRSSSPDIINDMFAKMRSNGQKSNEMYKLTMKEELVYYVVRIKQNNLLSSDVSTHKITPEQFWQQEKDSLAQLFSMFSQISGASCVSTNCRKSFSLDSYIERKDKLSLYSKKLSYSKIFEEI